MDNKYVNRFNNEATNVNNEENNNEQETAAQVENKKTTSIVKKVAVGTGVAAIVVGTAIAIKKWFFPKKGTTKPADDGFEDPEANKKGK